ncbi:TKL protein kinase [Phytophthora nicotianae P1569]|uniref:TKL protein kinase n=1 Tax=Phytophthora nicotianae P1569 TaxID=1317065 RepID=V9F9L3_PHYNI|nr:TKL protein kinase [Phytophthora nicotianae P1569]
MTATEDALETARLVIICTAAVISSVVAVVLFRRIPDPGYSTRGRGRGRSRSRKPPLPPPHATGPALYYSVVMTDWLFSVTGAVNQSMDMVMGGGVKVRTVVGASIDSLFHVSFLVSLLWGVVLAVFVLRTHRWVRGHQATSPPMKRFPVRTSWLIIWTIGLGSGLLSTARLQARITDSDATDTLANCQRYLYIAVFALSAGCVIAANIVLFAQRRRLNSVEELGVTAMADPSLGNSGDNAVLASTKTWELQAQQALRIAHEKLMHYFLVVQILQFPMMLCYVLGFDAISYATYEVADCLLFSVPLFNAIVFGWRHLGEPRFPRDEDDLRNNGTMLQSSSNSSRHGERQRDRMGTGLLAGSGNNGAGNVLASSFRTVFGSSAASTNNGKESMKSTYVGNEMVTLEELNGLSNVAFIAEGAAGSVYKAQWLGIEVAMKVIKLPNGGAGGVVDAELYRTIIQNSEEAFIEEAKLCSRLRHPNITLFMRAGYYEGKLGILTEYCSRGSLKDVLKRHFPLGWRRKVALALHISKGLTYLHARNPTYIHRDLKASNILVTETWQAKLADFGISKVSNFVNRVRYSERTVSLAEQNPSVSDELTSFAGTWRWNAPEILQDPHNCRYSRATDMYSFGMVLWEIASDGAVPFSDTKFDFEVREKVLVEQRPPINPRCPQRFAQLIEECWAQNPALRPSAPQAAEILNTILDNMSKDSNDFATLASVSGSEYTNSIFSSLRNGDGTSDLEHRPSSFLGQRITNFFRGRFSTRSSSSSAMSEEYHDHQENEHFYKFTSPYAGVETISMLSARGSGAVEYSPANYETSGLPIVGLPNDSRRGDGLVGGRLSSLDEYDFEMEGNPSDVSTTFSRSPSEGDSNMLPPFRQPSARREEVRPSEDPRPSEDEAEFVLGANGRIRHLQY